MKTKYMNYSKRLSYGVGIVFFLLLVGLVAVQAQDFNRITFPISELDNCTSVENCKVFCDQPTSMNACMSFAEKKGLMKK